MPMIRVLSYNVLLGLRSKKMFPWLARQTRADVVCLQEFPEKKINELISALPHGRFRYKFAPSLRMLTNIFGELTLYRTDRLKLTKSKIIDLGANRVERTFLLTKLPRTALLTEFVSKTGRFVLVTPQLVSLASNKLRYRQIDLILHALKNYKIPTFIIGDFNIPSLIANKKLTMHMATHGFTTLTKYMTTYRLSFIRYQLDYAFARKGNIEEIKVERVRFSDHYPIFVRLGL